MRKTPVTLGVLAIIFGSVVALYDGARLLLTSAASSLNKTFATAMANAPRKPGDPDPTVMLERAQSLQKELMPYTTTLMALMVLFSIALIVVGVGMYRRRVWARSAALGWSVLGLLYLAADTIVNLTVVLPKTQTMMRETLASLPNGDKSGAMMQVMGGAQTGVVVLMAVVLAVFPMLLIILVGRRSAANDFVD